MKIKTIAIALMALCSLGATAQQRLLGGDLSMLPKYEAAGTVYRDAKGKPVDALNLFRKEGWNAVRLRLFVDPDKAPAENKDEGVCQDLNYVMGFGKRIKEEGFRLMLDFHYSDTWADPGKQFIPSAWKGASAEALADSVYQYTRRSLEAMKRAGAEPDLIQVGNEISFGMLWPMAKTLPTEEANWPAFLAMLKQGCRACREICPKAQIIIHTEQAGNWSNTKAFYDRLEAARLDYDIIGLSYYPMWHERIPVLHNTLDSLARCYPDKQVMIVEAAAYYSHKNDRWAKSADEFSEFYPISVEGQTQFTKELVAELNRHPQVTGLFWWFPEENASGSSQIKSWLNRGLFDNTTGKALPSLHAMKKFLKP